MTLFHVYENIPHFLRIICGTQIKQYTFEYTTFKKHEIFKNPRVQMLLKDGTKMQKLGIPDFQNTVQTNNVSEKRV